MRIMLSAIAATAMAALLVVAGVAGRGEDMTMSDHASGWFAVTRTSQAEDRDHEGVLLGRQRLEKRYHGDLEGEAKGEMLTATTPVQGSAGYVALERITGALDGHHGSFVLQHSGIMDRGDPRLAMTVVPDSGTGGPAGIRGEMRLRIKDSRHYYEFDYTFDAPDK